MERRIKLKAEKTVFNQYPAYIIAASNGEKILIGQLYVQRNSGWNGGGQRWVFSPTNPNLEVRAKTEVITDMAGASASTKKELIAKVGEILAELLLTLDPEMPLNAQSTIIVRNL